MNQAIAVDWKKQIANAKEKFTQISASSGNLVHYQKEAMFAMQIIGEKDALQNCDPESIRNAVINVASVGLSLNPAYGLAYLVPRKGKCCLDVSYRGIVSIATESGSVDIVKAEIVYANDLFEYRGPFDMPRHEFNPFDTLENRGNIIGVCCFAKTKNVVLVETMSIEEVEKIKSVSKATSGPWVSWFSEMAKKSVIKRASKMWPRSNRLDHAVSILNEYDGIDIDAKPEIIMPKAKSPIGLSDAPIDPVASIGIKQDDRPMPEQQPEKPEAGGVLSPNQVKLIGVKIEQAGLFPSDLAKQFGVDNFHAIQASKINDVLKWISENAGT